MPKMLNIYLISYKIEVKLWLKKTLQSGSNMPQIGIINELFCYIVTTSSRTCFPILGLRVHFSTRRTLTPKMSDR
jgi:hypothetical protein